MINIALNIAKYSTVVNCLQEELAPRLMSFILMHGSMYCVHNHKWSIKLSIDRKNPEHNPSIYWRVNKVADGQTAANS